MCLAVPGRIVDTFDDRGTRMATIDFGGVHKKVCLAYLPDLQVGEYAIVHVGFAISRVDEASALETLQLFADLGIDLTDEVGPAEAVPDTVGTDAGAPSAVST